MIWSVLKPPARQLMSTATQQGAYSHLLVSTKPCSSFRFVLDVVLVQGTLPNQPVSHVRHKLRAVCSKEGDKTSKRVCRCSGLFTILWQSLHALEPQIHSEQGACPRNCLPKSCSRCSKCAQGFICKRSVRDCLQSKRRGPEVTLYSEGKMLKKVSAVCAAFHHL